MAITSIQFYQEVDRAPDSSMELAEGTTYNNDMIFVATNDDGTQQYLKFEVVYDSYGEVQGLAQAASLVSPRQKTVTVFE